MGCLLDRPPARPLPLGGGITHWPADISSPPHGRGLRGGRSKIIVSFNRARRKTDRNAYTARTARLIHPTSTLDRGSVHANHGSLAGDIVRTRADDVTERADVVPSAECVNKFETPVAGSLVSNAALPRVRAAWVLGG